MPVCGALRMGETGNSALPAAGVRQTISDRKRSTATETEQVVDSIAHLAQMPVRTPAGEAVELGELWRQQPIVLALIRHFG
jgi:hypothetical protein